MTRGHLQTLARVAWRGFLIVALVALNTRLIAKGHLWAAVGTGGAISLVWWGNARTSALVDVRGARWAYATGAALGTAAGLWLAG